MKVLAVAATYEELVATIIDRRKSLGLSQTDVDLIAGLPGGYQAKIEISGINPKAKNARGLGARSLPLVLRALGLHLGAFCYADARKKCQAGPGTDRKIERYHRVEAACAEQNFCRTRPARWHAAGAFNVA